MSGRHKPGRMPAKRWQPLRRAELVVPDKLAAATAADPVIATYMAEHASEVWRNDRYVVMVERRPDTSVARLSVRRADRKAVHDWRHMQRIKNEIAGDEVEGIELYPAESRKVDVANQYWIFCMPPDVRFPVGFTERMVLGPGEGPDTGAVQRAFEEDET